MFSVTYFKNQEHTLPEQNTLTYYRKNASDLVTRYETAEVEDLQSRLQTVFAGRAFSLLEIGCGSGRDASFMTARGFQVTAIDASGEMIEHAKRVHPELTMYQMQVPEGLQELPDLFEGVYSIATLMHLSTSQIDKTFAAIASKIVPDAPFFFSVSLKRDDIDGAGYDVKGRYFNGLTEDEWLSLCVKNGFQCEESFVSRDALDRDGIVWLSMVVTKKEDLE